MKTRRLDQLLSSLGYSSRRHVGGLLVAGRVLVAGERAEEQDQRVNPHDVTVDGVPVECPDGLLAVYHKPVGFVCSHSADDGPSIYTKLPPRWTLRNPSVTSVGRLDMDTSGVLMITDQGQLVQRWTSPRSVVDKVYIAAVDKPLDEALIAVFASGTILLKSETKPCLPARLDIIDPLHARLTITEGRYHQVRRMFASQGYQIQSLHRERFGPYDVTDLPVGQWRLLPVPQV
jgi:16S rRNA pseudouridine516 synthase